MADERPLEEQVRFEIVNDVAWITIDRPQVGNALSPPALNEAPVTAPPARTNAFVARGFFLFKSLYQYPVS